MIRIQNIYYMMAYAFRCLNENDGKKYSGEKFDNILDLFAVILDKAVSKQIKKGLFKDYIAYRDELYAPKGHICISDTINNFSRQQSKVVCIVDEFAEDTYANQILKSVMKNLAHNKDVRQMARRNLLGYLQHFQQVKETNLNHVDWNKITYSRNSSDYKMMMSVCRLIVDGMIVGEDEEKRYRLKEYVDDQRMSKLYEKFVFEYYKKHYPQLKISRPYIEWNTDDDNRAYLPVMKSDVTMRYKKDIFIIDAKYYAESMKINRQYGNKTVYSDNLYQIYTYVKNMDKQHEKNVCGMLLYANVDGMNPDFDYLMDGNMICVKTLDLNCDFENVKKQLNKYADDWMRKIDEKND